MYTYDTATKGIGKTEATAKDLAKSGARVVTVVAATDASTRVMKTRLRKNGFKGIIRTHLTAAEVRT